VLPVLDELIAVVRNATADLGGPEGYRNRYVDWVGRAENAFAGIASDPGVLAHLLTDRYWHIHHLPELARPFYVVDAEIQFQIQWLLALKTDLEQRVQLATTAPGHLTVLDTNVLLHYMPPDQINWPEVIGEPMVRLILPLRVIEELDEKKYTGRQKIAQRARDVLPRIEGIVCPSGSPGAVRENVTLEVFVEPGTRDRPEDADAEILRTASELRDLAGQPVSFVTGDTGARLRAQGLSLTTVKMPDAYLRNREANDV
jgi:hypothetical protein